MYTEYKKKKSFVNTALLKNFRGKICSSILCLAISLQVDFGNTSKSVWYYQDAETEITNTDKYHVSK